MCCMLLTGMPHTHSMHAGGSPATVLIVGMVPMATVWTPDTVGPESVERTCCRTQAASAAQFFGVGGGAGS